MTAQEKQATLQRLQIVTGIFQEFEQAYNMVVSLPKAKKAIYSEVGVPDPVKHAASKGTSILVTVIAYVILILPSVMVAGGLAGLLHLTNHTGLVLLLSIAINVVGAKYLGGFISKKIQAGGNKIQDTVNQQIRNSNQNANVHNAEVDRQIALAEQKCVAIRQRVSQMDMSWYPPYYCFSAASAFFYKAIINGMCETLGEAVKLYEEQRYRDQVLANQQKQIDLAYNQCILQAMTIATLYQEGAATRETMQAEGAATRQTMQAEGAATRGAIHAEGAAAREQRAQQHNDLRRWLGR